MIWPIVILSSVVTAGYDALVSWVGWSTEAVGGGDGVVVWNNFFYYKTQQHHFWNFILMTQCKLYVWQSTKRGRRWGRCSIYRHRCLFIHSFTLIQAARPINNRQKQWH